MPTSTFEDVAHSRKLGIRLNRNLGKQTNTSADAAAEEIEKRKPFRRGGQPAREGISGCLFPGLHPHEARTFWFIMLHGKQPHAKENTQEGKGKTCSGLRSCKASPTQHDTKKKKKGKGGTRRPDQETNQKGAHASGGRANQHKGAPELPSPGPYPGCQGPARTFTLPAHPRPRKHPHTHTHLHTPRRTRTPTPATMATKMTARHDCASPRSLCSLSPSRRADYYYHFCFCYTGCYILRMNDCYTTLTASLTATLTATTLTASLNTTTTLTATTCHMTLVEVLFSPFCLPLSVW